MKRIGILAFTDKGRALAEKTASALGDACSIEIFDSGAQSAKEYLAENFAKKDTFLFICAAGITVRLIAPLIRSKDVDPAVIVMDELGRYAIPLLSGHLGGANDAAAEIAAVTGAETVLTTATDINGKFAVDVWSRRAGCQIMNLRNIKKISSAVLRGEKIGLMSEFCIEGEMPPEFTQEKAKTGICVTLAGTQQPFEHTLNVVPEIVTIGAGCRRDVNPAQFEQFILKQLSENGIALEAVEKLASIELKKNERCMVSFSEKYGIPFVTYTPEELAAAQGDFTASELVKAVTGVDNVCERSAVLGSGNGRKLLSRTSGSGCTCALAMRDWKCRF